jgi:uncharacterized protein GlcG (DUF336 family)
MKKAIYLILGVALSLAACQKPAEEPAAAANPEPTVQTNPQSGGGTGPISPAAGGVSPVTNPQSVEGAGMGGVGQAAKDRARDVAGSASAPPPAPSEGD